MIGKILWLLATLLLGDVQLAEAQQPKKVSRIGLLISASTAVTAPYVDAFRQGLRELGYIDGKNIVLEIRGARQIPGEFPSLLLSWST